MTFLILLAAGLLAITAVALFYRWERQGNEHYAVAGLIILLVVESTLYPNQNTLPRSIFHPGLGTLQFRVPEIYISLALAGRIAARGWPRRIGITALLWSAYGAWLVVATVEGVLRHNNTTQLFYEAKAIVYVVGGFALAAGMPIRRLVEGRALPALLRLTAGLALLLDVFTETHKSVNFNLPLLPLSGFGLFGSETATILVTIGAVALLADLAKPKSHWRAGLLFLPIGLGAVVTNQRAALLSLGATALVLLLAAFGPTARRRLKVTSTSVVLALLSALAVVSLVIVVPATIHQRPVQVPFATQLNQTFHSQGKAESAQDRINQLQQAFVLIPQHVFIGWGLGVEYTYYELGAKKFVVTNLTHDIFLDLWLRSGLIGLGLFVSALALSGWEGVAAWRRRSDDVVAAIAIALVAVIVGQLVRGTLEPIFEEYRLATMLGLSMGILRAAVVAPDPGTFSLEAKGRERFGGASAQWPSEAPTSWR